MSCLCRHVPKSCCLRTVVRTSSASWRGNYGSRRENVTPDVFRVYVSMCSNNILKYHMKPMELRYDTFLYQHRTMTHYLYGCLNILSMLVDFQSIGSSLWILSINLKKSLIEQKQSVINFINWIIAIWVINGLEKHLTLSRSKGSTVIGCRLLYFNFANFAIFKNIWMKVANKIRCPRSTFLSTPSGRYSPESVKESSWLSLIGIW